MAPRNGRQRAFYLDTYDVWKHPGHGQAFKTDANDVVINPVYSALGSPDRIGDVGMLHSQKESNLYSQPIGRTAEDNIFTLDVLYVEANSDLEDQDVVLITTVGAPLEGSFLVIQGEGKARRSRGVRKGNYKVLQLKRTNIPASVGGQTGGGIVADAVRVGGFRTA